MTLTELQEERAVVENKMRELLDSAEGENRDMTEEENQRFDELHQAECEFRARIERAEKLEAIQAASSERRNERRSGDMEERELARTTAIERRNENLSARSSHDGAGFEKRSDEYLSFEGWCLRSFGQRVGQHHHEAAKRLGTDIYQDEYSLKLANNREFRELRRRWERRDLSIVGDSNNETDIIRTDFLAQLEREMLAFGDVLQVSTQFRTDGGNPITIPTVTDVDNLAGDTAEGSSGDDVTDFNDDPTFGKVTFSAFKASTMVKYTTELEQDAGFDLTSELASLLGERIGRKLNHACTVGGGTGAAQGVVTGSSLGHTAAVDDEIEADDILELIHSLDPAYRNTPGVGFMMHDKILLEVRKLKEEDSGRYLWQPSLQLGVPSTLLGYPIYNNQSMTDAMEAGEKILLFGDYRKFRVRLVRGVRLTVARELYAETDEVGMIAHIRYDSRVLQPKAIRHLVMAAGS